jgi:hypothetical protein
LIFAIGGPLAEQVKIRNPMLTLLRNCLNILSRLCSVLSFADDDLACRSCCRPGRSPSPASPTPTAHDTTTRVAGARLGGYRHAGEVPTRTSSCGGRLMDAMPVIMITESLHLSTHVNFKGATFLRRA